MKDGRRENLLPFFGKVENHMDNYLNKYELERFNDEISVEEYLEKYVNVDEFLQGMPLLRNGMVLSAV